ncbi:MAG: hypothetical protein A2147_02005 [Chloroflexi bacterium RBG_16_57_8]|nr:MAG: hypothetical protein A2147_02005 [Chloroflexi bacterium RBG_16_57_8]
MPTEQQIKELAYALWEQEGRPDGKDEEHYYRAREILVDQEKANVIKLPPPPPTAKLAAPAATPKLKEAPKKSTTTTRGKKA